MNDDFRSCEATRRILGRDPDPALIRLVRDLDALIGAAEPPPRLVATLERALAERGMRGGHTLPAWDHRRSASVRRLPIAFGRMGNAIAAALLVLLIGVSIIGLTVVPSRTQSSFGGVSRATPTVSTRPALEQAVELNASTRQIEAEGLWHRINEVWSLSGFTVRFERAYADANRVVVAYTIQAPVGRSFNHALLNRMSLTDRIGNELRPLSCGTNATEKRVDGDVYGQIACFDAPRVALEGATELALHVQGWGMGVVESVGDGASATEPSGSAGIPDGGSAAVHPGCPSEIRCYVLPGTFAFDFTVPVEPRRRVVEPRQAVRIGDREVVLERVVVTPTEARFSIRGLGDAYVRRVTTNGYDSERDSMHNSTGWSVRPDQSVSSLDGALIDHPGELTVTVASSNGSADSWIFTFVVP